MKRLTLLATVSLLAAAGASHAQGTCAHDEACLAWSQELTYTDGTPLNDLAGFRVVYGTAPEVLYQTIQLNDPGMRAYVVTGLGVGRYYFAVRSINEEGVESGLSNIVEKTILAEPAPTPVPPALSVTETTVYQVLGILDKFVLLDVGTVADGTECIASQSVNGYYAVPRAAVSWYGSVRPQIVVARCGG